MDVSRLRRVAGVLVLAGTLSACAEHPPAVPDLPGTRETLTRVGKRLSRSLSADELTALAGRGDRVLAQLTTAERAALARGYLRFRLDRPAVVSVAAPVEKAPFWLADQGFAATALVLKTRGREWTVWQKRFAAGWVGLGVNALDRRASAHYAVFVQPDPGGSLALADRDRAHWRIQNAQEGPFATIPPELRDATLIQPADDLRHSTYLASGRVWKTHVVSGPQPDQVAIAFGDDPSRALVWTWRTEPTVTATALRLKSREGPARIIAGDSRLVESPNLLNDPLIRRHRARVEGLEPNTEYAYSLGDGTLGGWSEWRTVRTAPDRADRYCLLYLGDAQCGLESWGKLLHQAYRHRPDAGAILLAGDLVDRGNERTNWDHFFLRADGVFDRLPLMPAVGNHEYLDQGPRLYRAFFDLPRNGPAGVDANLVYSFEYVNTFVAVLDSTIAVFDPEQAHKQAEWLDKALTHTRAQWKLVMFHHPIHASHPTREYPGLGAVWGPVFDKHHVDLVLQGHDHAYLRTYPMRANRVVDSTAEGTVYMVAVSGDKYCEQDPRDYTARGLTHTSTYQTIDVSVPNNRLTLTAWDARGREVDRFTIEKPNGPTQVAGREP